MPLGVGLVWVIATSGSVPTIRIPQPGFESIYPFFDENVRIMPGCAAPRVERRTFTHDVTLVRADE